MATPFEELCLCPSCSSVGLKLTAEPAAHDCTLIDLIAKCEDCGLMLNAFVSVAEMTVIPEED